VRDIEGEIQVSPAAESYFGSVGTTAKLGPDVDPRDDGNARDRHFRRDLCSGLFQRGALLDTIYWD
jgi:hypothetical protein